VGRSSWPHRYSLTSLSQRVSRRVALAHGLSCCGPNWLAWRCPGPTELIVRPMFEPTAQCTFVVPWRWSPVRTAAFVQCVFLRVPMRVFARVDTTCHSAGYRLRVFEQRCTAGLGFHICDAPWLGWPGISSGGYSGITFCCAFMVLQYPSHAAESA